MLELEGPGLKKAGHRLNQFSGLNLRKARAVFSSLKILQAPTGSLRSTQCLELEIGDSKKLKARKNMARSTPSSSSKKRRFRCPRQIREIETIFRFYASADQKKISTSQFFWLKNIFIKKLIFFQKLSKKTIFKKYENCNSIWNSISVEIFCVCAEGFGFSNSF